jgi:imidazolonepropionase-like amidohydrolase
VTTTAVYPGTANVIGGQGGTFKTVRAMVTDQVYLGPAGMQVALGEQPKQTYSGDRKTPSTRMGVASLLRETLVKAQNYTRKLQKAVEPDKAPERDVKMEAMLPVLRREQPLVVFAQRADDIMTAIRIGQEFGLRLRFVGAAEAHKVVTALKEAGAEVILGPLMGARVRVEQAGRILDTAAILAQAGVPLALTTNHPGIPAYLAMV